MSSQWRTTGITYLQYVQMASAAARNCLKQPLREQVQARGSVHFRERAFSNTRLQETRFVDDFSKSPVSFKRAAE